MSGALELVDNTRGLIFVKYRLSCRVFDPKFLGSTSDALSRLDQLDELLPLAVRDLVVEFSQPASPDDRLGLLGGLGSVGKIFVCAISSS